MKKKIFYWSPCLTPVGTVKSTINSAASLVEYGEDRFQVILINACGEWDEYIEFFNKKNIAVINLSYNFFKYLPKQGFISSRFSYILIYIFCFIPLSRLLIKYKPDFLIAHLITSLPLTIMNLFKLKTQFVLRISGMPKLNLLRKFFWKYSSNKLNIITCPTLELKLKLLKMKLFKEKNLYYLPDAIIEIKNFINQSNKNNNELEKFKNNKIIISAGRLTTQKNFNYLIDEFAKFSKENEKYILLILGEGEERNRITNNIKKYNLQNKVFLMGQVKSVYKYFIKADVFILSSLWEEVGFVIVEAAMSNLFIISSDCPNGPSEFLNHGKNGILFKNNQLGAISESLKKYVNLTDVKKNNDKVAIKKNVKSYSKFRHFLKLESILKKNY